DRVEDGAQPVDGVGAPAAADRAAKLFLHARGVLVEHRDHEIVLGLEVLVEGGLAYPHLLEDLIEADVAKAVAVEAPEGGIEQSLAGGRWRDRLSWKEARGRDVVARQSNQRGTSSEHPPHPLPRDIAPPPHVYAPRCR